MKLKRYKFFEEKSEKLVDCTRCELEHAKKILSNLGYDWIESDIKGFDYVIYDDTNMDGVGESHISTRQFIDLAFELTSEEAESHRNNV